ncbi:dolichyl-phosphate beta-glucosyltransferase [Fodinicola acaciae]|uniref:dolichyl-phosphate beta-glucosyltransferase n=1 Tax=Fodinicola acaciae TaxID=2681555 RepID=UPI0013D216F9|nr:dolichyl-phosphate beta-glucosyltransferase [Fodinicola acaciae]
MRATSARPALLSPVEPRVWPGRRAREPRVVDLTVVIPVYNEHERLGATLAAVRQHLDASGESWELLVCDDGSTDETAALVRPVAAADPRVRLLRSIVNRGKGHAVRRGVAASHGRRVAYCDADLATPIGELARLRDRLDRGFAAAIGSRSGRDNRVEVSQHPVRVALGRAGNRLIRLLAVPEIADTQCGFKMFDGDKARRAFALARIDGWGFDVEILHLFRRSGWPVAEVPVRWSHQPGSKVRPLDYPRVLADVVRVRLIHGTRRLP